MNFSLSNFQNIHSVNHFKLNLSLFGLMDKSYFNLLFIFLIINFVYEGLQYCQIFF